MTDQYRVDVRSIDVPKRTAVVQITATNPDSLGVLFLDAKFLITALRDVLADAPKHPFHALVKAALELRKWEYALTIPFDRIVVTEMKKNSALYEVVFSNARYLDGLEVGASAGSTAYGDRPLKSTYKKWDIAASRGPGFRVPAEERKARAAFEKEHGVLLPVGEAPLPPKKKAARKK